MNVITASPEGPNSNRKVQVVRLTDIEKTTGQVDVLLKIADHCSGIFFEPTALENRCDRPQAASDTALKTFELAHLQLRQLIDEQSRWSTEDRVDEGLVDEMLENSIALLAEQRSRLAEASRPSRRFQPRLAKLESGQWIAWYGFPEPVLAAPRGLGSTPEEAVQDFDRNFVEPPPAQKPASKPRKRKR